eukprot:COSAG05_NODE_17295_length_328_cov_0.672489_1_plen_65_part_10
MAIASSVGGEAINVHPDVVCKFRLYGRPSSCSRHEMNGILDGGVRRAVRGHSSEFMRKSCSAEAR